ncbi:class I SAM-dependent methyltransferase [Nocardioides marmorisolisilvae]|uniref:class I SAM-dependent methyltransferase n=1 Tax=Nocardioides marmorisolisilvae TaxID=1542737 RepID=UPI001616B726|nr:class I SAM-dependent methyltransferase [Nocardioides marmorisolisilvae]
MSEFAAYDVAAASWDQGPGRLYGATADALLEVAPVPVAGARVLDLGAGTGIAGRAALGRGAASVVATDRAAEMLRQGVGRIGVQADANRLPFADGSFDLVVAAFVINHLDDPVRGLGECRRVATAIVASSFDRSWDHPAKTVVDEVMAQVGFVAPDWYAAVQVTNDQVKDPVELGRLAEEAGYTQVTVNRIEVPTGITDPAAMVEWRWGMAHLAPFVAGLDAETRERMRVRSEEAAVGLPPVVVPMLALSAS